MDTVGEQRVATFIETSRRGLGLVSTANSDTDSLRVSLNGDPETDGKLIAILNETAPRGTKANRRVMFDGWTGFSTDEAEPPNPYPP